jgi:5-methylcytosine-specific restriction endonuclease McrA
VLPHEIDHIRARKHRGLTTMDNTCLACAHCNAAKGTDATAGLYPLE